MDPVFDDPKPRYHLCQYGFGLIALALGLLCLSEISILAALFGANWLQAMRSRPAWLWLVDAPITWGSLLGSYLLWGRWTDPPWLRRVGLLLLLNAADAAFWTVGHARELGLGLGEIGPRYDWLFFLVSYGFGWLELMLIAALGAEVSAHLGKADAPEAAAAARVLGIIGLGLGALFAATQTDWRAWPPRFGPTQVFPVLWLVSALILGLTTFQVTALCLTTARQCRQYRAELDRGEWGHDAPKSRSEDDDCDDIQYL